MQARSLQGVDEVSRCAGPMCRRGEGRCRCKTEDWTRQDGTGTGVDCGGEGPPVLGSLLGPSRVGYNPYVPSCQLLHHSRAKTASW